MKTYRSLALASVLGLSLVHALPSSAGSGCERSAAVKVDCSTASAFVNIDISNCRKIGHVLIEVKNTQGRVLYREEGKALTGELIRRLDKGVFPKGEMTLSVTARDFAITQVFNVQ